MFASQFSSILRESDTQADQKYVDWFGLDFSFFFSSIKPKPNQEITNWVELGILGTLETIVQKYF